MLQQIKHSANRFAEKAGADWQELYKESLLIRLVDVFLRSYGQILFADNAATGFLLITALMMISAGTVLFSLVGTAVASLTAHLLKKEDFFIRHGIYGYNGALLGFFWSWYFTVSVSSIIVFIFMAIMVVPLQSYLMKKISLGRFNLPVLSLPAVVVFICALMAVHWLVYGAGLLPPAVVYIINGLSPEPLIDITFPAGNGFTGIILSQHLPSWILILAGIALNSRISALAALLGVTGGYAIVHILPYTAAAEYAGTIFIGFNAVPVAMSLFGVFLVAGLWSFLFTFAALAFCAVVWLLLVNTLTLFNFPFLTLPFTITVFITLIITRKSALPPAGLYPVPLEVITTPENIIRWHKYNVLIRPAPFSPGNIISLLKHPLRLFGQNRKEIAQFLEIMHGAKRITILSGAGTSTESGIPDFRGGGSFWKQFQAEDFTYDNFLLREDIRARYWAMERQFYKIILNSRINPVHEMAKWLTDQGRLAGIISQNVDGLFQRAGVAPDKVIEIHGTVNSVQCLKCKAIYSRQALEALFNAGVFIPCCEKCGGLLKPATIFMGEDVDKTLFEKSLTNILASDLFLVMGTSLRVDPVAKLPDIARQSGVQIVIINTLPTPKDHLALMVINTAAGRFFKKILRRLNINYTCRTD